MSIRITAAFIFLLFAFAAIMYPGEPAPLYAQTAESTSPGAPAGISLERGQNSLTVSWVAPFDGGGSRVIAYGVQWQESGQPWGGSTVNLRWTDSSPYVIAGLNTGTTYDVRVFAQSAVGLSDPSEIGAERPADKSSAPTGLKLVGGMDSSITVSWIAPLDTGGMPLEYYVVRWRTGDEEWERTFVSKSESSHTIVGLTNGTTYDVLVVPVTGNNWWGENARVTGAAGFRPPGATTGVSVERARESLVVSWAAPSDDGGRRVIAYGVQWQERGQMWAGSTVNLRWVESSPYTITGLSTGTTYDVRVFAQNAVGLSDPSDVVTGRPADRASAPTELGVSGGADSSLTVDWAAPLDTGGTPIRHYVVRWKSGEEDWSSDRQADTTSMSYTITGLTNETEYDIVVVPVTDGNLWGTGATVSGTAGFRTPASPTGVSLERGQNSLTVSWTAPSDDGGRRVLAYGIQWQESGQPWAGSTVRLRWTESPPYIITGLNTGTTYDVRVFSLNAVGLGHHSAVVTGRPAGNSDATGMPTISGTLVVGRTLTASTSEISDANGLPETDFSYQWIANDGAVDLEIEGATQPSYTLTEDDVGKSISVRVSFLDSEGFAESVTSVETSAVSAAPEVPQVAWEGMLTAEEHSSIVPAYSGYSDSGSLGGTLTPAEFTWEGVTYNIYFLVNGGGGLHLGLGEPPSNDFILQIGDASYVGSDSTIPSTGVDAAFLWPSPPSVWTVGNPVKVSLAFSDDTLPADRLPAPLVAYFFDVPKKHDGQSDLKFRIYFSEGTTITDDALSQHLVVIGGELVNVIGVGSEGRIWALTLRPNPGQDVSVVMPAETNCGVPEAICAADGRMFSNRIEVIIRSQMEVVHK